MRTCTRCNQEEWRCQCGEMLNRPPILHTGREIKVPERTRRYVPDADAKILMGFKVVSKLYSSVRRIFAELGQSDTILLRALKEGHEIEINTLIEDPMLYFIVSQEQLEELKKIGVKSPTFLQIFGTSEIVDRTEAEAIRRFKAMKEEP